jgi:hypothetical protein
LLRPALLIATCAFGCSLLAPGRASAQPVVYPAADAIDVPTDVVPYIDDFIEDGSVRLERLDGTPVDAEVTLLGYSFGPNGTGSSAFEIRPEAELAPATAYAIRALYQWQADPIESTFTTGAGPATDPVPAEPTTVTAQLSHIRAESGRSGNLLCLLAAPAPFVDVTVFLPGATHGSRFIREGSEHELYQVFAPMGSCVQVRARNAAGMRSAPVERCPLPFFAQDGWWPSCSSGRVVVDGQWFADEGPPDAGDGGAAGHGTDGGDPLGPGGSTGAPNAAPPATAESDASNSDSASSCAIAAPGPSGAGGLTILVAAALAFVARALRLVKRAGVSPNDLRF